MELETIVYNVFEESKRIKEVQEELTVNPRLSFFSKYAHACAYVEFDYNIENGKIISVSTNQVIHFNCDIAGCELEYLNKGLEEYKDAKTRAYIEFVLIHEMRHIYQHISNVAEMNTLLELDMKLRNTGEINNTIPGMQPLEKDADDYAYEKCSYSELNELIAKTTRLSHRATYMTDELEDLLLQIVLYIEL